MRIRTRFPYDTAHEDVWIPLPDGTRLYARIWRPITDEPVPALLEYLPYRLSDWTAPRDRQRHPWYAGHGYASVRVDARGHGNSEGLPGDAYDETGPADGVAVVHWLAGQEWCSGRVGMFGISWGGSISLRIAALAPEPLKAIVTVCSTDDRYDNDVHYMGGSVLAVGMHARAATTLAFAARPPDPAHVGDGWKAMWLKRLEAVHPPIHTWLAHRTRDAYWTHGSVCEDYSAIDATVLAVGGWHDPYRDTVLRLVAHLDPAKVRGLIGPWSRQYPDRGLSPGPSIGFLQETLRWWDQHLKDEDTGVMSEPLLRSWISESHRPATVYETLPGRWVGDTGWPSKNVTTIAYALQGVVVLPVTLDEPRPERLVVRDVAKGEWRLEVDPRYGGTRVHPDGLEFTEDGVDAYTIQENDPLSARTRSDWTIRLHRPETAWDVKIETRSEISGDEHDFLTSDEMVCKDGDEIVFRRTWVKRIPRTAG
ncbi:CocE/NonD family hydrolase [Streptomyces sp. NPDC002206]